MNKNYLLFLVVPLLALLTSCANNQQHKLDEQRKEAFVRVNEILDSGNSDELGNYILENAVDHQLEAMGSTQSGLAGIKELFNKLHTVFPDMKTTIHSMAISGDTLFAWTSSTGTLAEPFMGMPAGQKQTVSSVDVVRYEGDKMAEHWAFTDMTEFMKMQQEEMKHIGTDSTGNMMQ